MNVRIERRWWALLAVAALVAEGCLCASAEQCSEACGRHADAGAPAPNPDPCECRPTRLVPPAVERVPPPAPAAQSPAAYAPSRRHAFPGIARPQPRDGRRGRPVSRGPPVS